MPEHVKGQHGWDGPVEIRLPGEVAWENDAIALAALIQDSAPLGRGTLRKDLSLRRAGYKRIKKAKKVAGFELVVHNAYALAQDQGADIPERRPKGYMAVGSDASTVLGPRAGRALRWQSGGGYVFAKRARAFRLPGQNYLDKGMARWVNGRGHEGLQVAWASAQGEVR